MNDILAESSAAFVVPVGSEGGRSPSTLPTGQAMPVGGLAPGQRWSVGRKREVVLRLLRGESAHDLSRELGVPLYRLEGWRERALSGIDGSLREREGDSLSEELSAAMKRIGELTMENEVLRMRVGHAGPWPVGGRGDGRRDLTWHRPSLRCCSRLRRLGCRPFILLRLAAAARAQRSTTATVTPRSQAGDLGGCRVERDPGRFGSFALDWRGASQGLGATARARRASDCPQTGAAADAGEWPAVAAPSSAAPRCRP